MSYSRKQQFHAASKLSRAASYIMFADRDAAITLIHFEHAVRPRVTR